MMRIPCVSLPSRSALCLDYINGSSRGREFYRQDYSLEAVVSFARQRPALDRAHRETLCTVLDAQQRQWGANPSSVEKLRAGAVAVICGQQPGLFTGPNYTILKAITAIKLARALGDRGVTAVPVFWIAAEDHDYQEIEWAAILDRDSALQQVRVNLSHPEPRPSAWLGLDDDVVDAISNCLTKLPESEFQPEVRDLLMMSYKPGMSPVDAFARMLARLFEGSHLILVNPLDAELRKLATGTLHQVVRQNSAVRSALLARNRALSKAGYHEQVKIDEDFSGFFAYRGKSRQAVRTVQSVDIFDRARDRMTSELESLRPALDAVDSTLAGALDTARQKILHQVETLRTKFVNAEARRNETLERHLETIGNSLFPEKKLQERVLNITSFLVRYGLAFLPRLEETLSLDSRAHQVVEI